MSGERQPEEIEMHEKAAAAVAEFERINPSHRPPDLFQAQFDGVKAFLEGKTAIDCPFTEDQSEYYSWFNGFSSAEKRRAQPRAIKWQLEFQEPRCGPLAAASGSPSSESPNDL